MLPATRDASALGSAVDGVLRAFDPSGSNCGGRQGMQEGSKVGGGNWAAWVGSRPHILVPATTRRRGDGSDFGIAGIRRAHSFFSSSLIRSAADLAEGVSG
jgi:hypothetical protein